MLPPSRAGRLDFGATEPHHRAQIGPPIGIHSRRSYVETVVGIVLVIISAFEIVWITRTVQANTPR